MMVNMSFLQVVTVVSEKEAWEISKEFSHGVAQITGKNLKAVIVIGSLAGGNYRPGTSDIDIAVIVDDECSQEQKLQVRERATFFRDKYAIPKDFGAVIIMEKELFPPYDPAQELVPEILRLKHQGIIIQGFYELDKIPEPTKEDFKSYARVFYPWLRTNYIDNRSVEARTVDAIVNTLLYELRLFIWDVQNEFVFNKEDVLRMFLKIPESHYYCNQLNEVEKYLKGFVTHLTIEQVERTLKDVSIFVRGKVKWFNSLDTI